MFQCRTFSKGVSVAFTDLVGYHVASGLTAALAIVPSWGPCCLHFEVLWQLPDVKQHAGVRSPRDGEESPLSGAYSDNSSPSRDCHIAIFVSMRYR